MPSKQLTLYEALTRTDCNHRWYRDSHDITTYSSSTNEWVGGDWYCGLCNTRVSDLAQAIYDRLLDQAVDGAA